jgi:hypothetical protein
MATNAVGDGSALRSSCDWTTTLSSTDPYTSFLDCGS